MQRVGIVRLAPMNKPLRFGGILNVTNGDLEMHGLCEPISNMGDKQISPGKATKPIKDYVVHVYN